MQSNGHWYRILAAFTAFSLIVLFDASVCPSLAIVSMIGALAAFFVMRVVLLFIREFSNDVIVDSKQPF